VRPLLAEGDGLREGDAAGETLGARVVLPVPHAEDERVAPLAENTDVSVSDAV
jgi:hypothetical protein